MDKKNIKKNEDSYVVVFRMYRNNANIITNSIYYLDWKTNKHYMGNVNIYGTIHNYTHIQHMLFEYAVWNWENKINNDYNNHRSHYIYTIGNISQ